MKTDRIHSLDVFRGITVAAMILVNNPGSWDSVYPPLLHARWNGCTPTDLIFPFFLFIVGMSIHFAYQPRLEEGLTKKIFLKILKRALIIFALGILLAWFPTFSISKLTTLRIPGVLQRISIVFFFCSIIYFKMNWLAQIRTASVLLVGYFLLMTLVPVPDFGVPNLEPETNLSAWLDRFLLNGHLWLQSKTWDPEGVLSTLPAIATGITGLLTGQFFSKIDRPELRTTWLFFLGCTLTVAGSAWGLFFPINKSLWTSSYVLYTAGIAMQFFAFCYWIIDVHGWKKWAQPFVYYGTNAIFVFVASGALAKILIWAKIDEDGNQISLWGYIYKNAYASWLEPRVASLAFASTFVLLFLAILWWMYRKKIFIKV